MSQKKYTVAAVASRIEAFLRPLLKSARLRLDFTPGEGASTHPEVDDPDVAVRFSGEDVDLLLANKAELLLALEHLTHEALRLPSEDHSRISFDANDYRALRIEELRLSAITACDKVKRTGVPFRFNPMNSRERRIIHLALRNETDVRSESYGSGTHRQVVVYPAGMAAPAAPPEPPRMPGRGRSARR